MITAVFLIFFLETGGIQIVSDQNTFSTVEECELYANNRIYEEQEAVKTGENSPHKAIFKCVDWGTDA